MSLEAHPELLNPGPLVKHYEVVASTLSTAGHSEKQKPATRKGG